MPELVEHRRLVAVGLSIRGPAAEVYLNPADAHALDVHPGDRVAVQTSGTDFVPAAVRTSDLTRVGEAGLNAELQVLVGHARQVEVHPFKRAGSLPLIRRKLDGQRLTDTEIETVYRDIASGRLGTAEVAAWACGVHVHGMDTEETVASVRAMVSEGQRIRFDRTPIMDVHSIGGVPGNKYAPIAVAIVAEHGLWIPKTSSRAISSACGTADFMETVAPVALSAKRIQEVTAQAGGALVWGGGVGLAPADDVIIRVEYPLALDPPSQIVASVLAKKLAVGANRVLIDLPVGNGAKLADKEAATRLGAQFIEVGSRLGMEVQCLVSSGAEPLGHAIGPVLEMREALSVLEGHEGAPDLAAKACSLAGRLLEMGGAVPAGQGEAAARACLADGRALTRFRAIVKAQGGRPDISTQDLRPGRCTASLEATRAGRVTRIDNRALVQIARAAGSPRDVGAGLLVRRKTGEPVEAGEELLHIHAEHPNRLQEALGLARTLQPIHIDSPVMGFIT